MAKKHQKLRQHKLEKNKKPKPREWHWHDLSPEEKLQVQARQAANSKSVREGRKLKEEFAEW
jgi:hypothetical protein